MAEDTKRTSIPKADQLHVWNRDNWTCKYCEDPVFFAPTLKLLEEKSPGHGYYQGHGKDGEIIDAGNFDHLLKNEFFKQSLKR